MIYNATIASIEQPKAKIRTEVLNRGQEDWNTVLDSTN